MWSSGPASQGQFSGNGCREQVITRQPAAEKRFTVAWPIPREAPVRIMARCGVEAELDIERADQGLGKITKGRSLISNHEMLGIKPGARPVFILSAAREHDAV